MPSLALAEADLMRSSAALKPERIVKSWSGSSARSSSWCNSGQVSRFPKGDRTSSCDSDISSAIALMRRSESASRSSSSGLTLARRIRMQVRSMSPTRLRRSRSEVRSRALSASHSIWSNRVSIRRRSRSGLIKRRRSIRDPMGVRVLSSTPRSEPCLTPSNEVASISRFRRVNSSSSTWSPAAGEWIDVKT